MGTDTPGVMVLLSVLSQPGYRAHAKSTVMPDLAACEQGAELLRRQVAIALPFAHLRTYALNTAQLRELGAATT